MGKLATYGVQHHLTVPHRPQSNGVAEAAVKLVKEGILRWITRAGESRKNWDELVGIVCVSINNSVMRTGMLSRAETFLGGSGYQPEKDSPQFGTDEARSGDGVGAAQVTSRWTTEIGEETGER
jgi:hypothetical protein